MPILTRIQILEHLSSIAESAATAGSYAPAVSALTKLAKLAGYEDKALQEAETIFDFSRLSDAEFAQLRALLERARRSSP